MAVTSVSVGEHFFTSSVAVVDHGGAHLLEPSSDGWRGGAG